LWFLLDEFNLALFVQLLDLVTVWLNSELEEYIDAKFVGDY
jgi:hypothetical protein